MTQSQDILTLTSARLNQRLPALAQRLRGRLLPEVARQLIALTDGAVTSDPQLISTLVQIATAASRRWLELSATLRAPQVATPEGLSPQAQRRTQVQRETGALLPSVASAAAVDAALTTALADRIDHVLLCLECAASVARSLPPAHLPAGRVDSAQLVSELLEIAAQPFPTLAREAALVLARELLVRAPEHERPMLLGVSGQRRIRAVADRETEPVFVRCKAIALLQTSLGRELEDALVHWLHEARGKDGAFIRVQAARSLVELVSPEAASRSLARVKADPSEYCRQTAATLLSRLGAAGAEEVLALATSDASPRVRGHTLLALSAAAAESASCDLLYRALDAVDTNTDTLVQRAALEASARLAGRPSAAGLWKVASTLLSAPNLSVAEQAALLLRRLELAQNSDAGELLTELAALPRTLRIGKHRQLRGEPTSLLLKCAVCCAAHDVPWGLGRSKGGTRVHRGETPHLSLWRIIYEWRHPAPDKRLAFAHSTAPDVKGSLRTVPISMGAVTATRVPGERVVEGAGSWGGHLPRPADLIAALRERHLVLAGVFGHLHIQAPRSLAGRLRARLRLWFLFARLAALRTRELQEMSPRTDGSFIEEAMALGFSFTWAETDVVVSGRRISVAPDAVRRAFPQPKSKDAPWDGTQPLLLAVPALSLDGAVSYALSPSGNLPWHLAIVVWFLLSGLLLRAARTKARFERAQRRLPLSIGGWGSRGKSGTERLKAALFHSQHYDVISKTTGCEAMMIVAKRGQPAEEVFLFRPYDKASIWEQESVVKYADAARTQVFLWECMALQPEFVDILNRQWMQDEICTLTNTYPDHEDVMGPSGEDVARVIGRFVPKRGHLLTSEDGMLPLLREAAMTSDASLSHTAPLTADLLPQDLLARFPYAEHPRNIALVLDLANHLGLDRERALADMADYVVPDLGVLKTFREVSLRNRRIRFSNGMSANERAGFLSNWVRLGFDDATPERAPCELSIAVVNNRADRIPRSQVFADLLVRDAPCDRIVIIGTNPRGMRRYLLQKARALARTFQLPSAPSEARAEASRLLCKYLRLPDSTSVLAAQLAALVEAGSEDPITGGPELELALKSGDLPALPALLEKALPPESLSHGLLLVETWRLAAAARMQVEQLTGAGRSAEAQEALARAYVELFEARLVLVESAAATGDELMTAVLNSFGPGLRAHALGCQNIKGAGTAYVYAWQAIERTSQWLDEVESGSIRRDEALAALLNHPTRSVVERELIEARAQQWSQRDELQPARELLRAALSVNPSSPGASTRGRRERLLARPAVALLVDLVEAWLDPFAAVARRRRATRTLQATLDQRLSVQEAALLLRQITREQKGGWLRSMLSRRRR